MDMEIVRSLVLGDGEGEGECEILVVGDGAGEGLMSSRLL